MAADPRYDSRDDWVRITLRRIIPGAYRYPSTPSHPGHYGTSITGRGLAMGPAPSS